MSEQKNFSWPVTAFPKYDYDEVYKWNQQYGETAKNKQIVIFGAGIRGSFFLDFLQEFGFKNICFTDNNPAKVGGMVNGCPILPYEEVVRMQDNIIVIVSVENALSIKEQLRHSGFVENKNFFYLESNLYQNFITNFLEQKDTKTIVMGDCGLTDIARADIDYRSLSDLIYTYLGKDYTKVLAVHAMGMRAFYHILHAYSNLIQKPKTVVVMVNFDALTGKQHLLPRSQNTPLIQKLTALLNHKDYALEEYAYITQERFERFTTDCFTSSQENIQELSKDKNDRLVFRISYMYKLSTGIEPMIYMKKIIDLCKDNKINLFFFIPPINSEYGTELWGKRFREKYDENVAVLKAFIGDEIPVLDFSDIATRDEFAQRNTVDEIVRFEARQRIAFEIAKAVHRQGEKND